jgi:hypothetical protein
LEKIWREFCRLHFRQNQVTTFLKPLKNRAFFTILHLFVVLDSTGPRPAAAGAVSFKRLRNVLQNQVNNFLKPLKNRAFFRILHLFVVLDSAGPRPAAADAVSFKSLRNAVQNQINTFSKRLKTVPF